MFTYLQKNLQRRCIIHFQKKRADNKTKHSILVTKRPAAAKCSFVRRVLRAKRTMIRLSPRGVETVRASWKTDHCLVYVRSMSVRTCRSSRATRIQIRSSRVSREMKKQRDRLTVGQRITLCASMGPAPDVGSIHSTRSVLNHKRRVSNSDVPYGTGEPPWTATFPGLMHRCLSLYGRFPWSSDDEKKSKSPFIYLHGGRQRDGSVHSTRHP
jgi:hypothetical protein